MMKSSNMQRRTFLRLACGGGIVLLGGGVALLGGKKTPSLLRGSRTAMGTRATILLTHASADVASAVMQAAFDDIARIDRKMSRFRSDSDVGRLNANRAHWIAVAPETAVVLHRAVEIAGLSEGYFDPCLDGLVSQWGFHDHNYRARIHTSSALLRERGEAFYTGLAYRRHSARDLFRLTPQSPGIDLGGIAKGYAIDQAARRLRAAGVRHALINVGDDILAIGGHPDGGPWRVGIRHPRQPGSLLQVLNVRNRAVATSGDYANYFYRSGKRFSHLFDPHTGKPSEAHRSFTVITQSAMMADALATAAFTTPPDRVPRLLARGKVDTWLGVDAGGRTYGSAV